MRPAHALAALLLAFGQACTNMDKRADELSVDSIKIGMIDVLPLPGSIAAQQNGAFLACQEINANGGVFGHKLEMLITGDSLDPPVLSGTKFLLDAGVVAIVGGTSSTHTTLMAPLVTGKVPILGPSVTSPSIAQLPGAGTWIFHVPPSDAFQGLFLADKILGLNIRSVGIIHTLDVFGSNLALAFKARFEGQGGSVMTTVSCPTGSPTGYGPYVADLFRNGVPAGVLIIANAGLDSAAMSRDIQVYNPQPKPAYFGCDVMTSVPFLMNAAPEIRDGMYGTAPGSPTDINYTNFQERYIQSVGYAPVNSYVACAYDAIYLIAYAMVAGRAATPQAISQHLRDVSGGIVPKGTPIYVNEFAKGAAILAGGGRIDYQGASGKIDFNATGDPTSGVYLWWQIQNGAVKVLETVPFSGD